jgi:S1-C subfamily serine protease
MLLDLLIIVLGSLAIYRGRDSGFLRQFWASIGFFGGLFIGSWLGSHTISLGQTTSDRGLLTLLTIIGMALVGLALGEYIGLHFKHRLLAHRLNKLDNGLGSLLGVTTSVLSIWLLASLAISLPYRSLQSTVHSSHIVAGLNHVLPPAPKILSGLERLIDPNGFPDVFIGNEPIPKGNVNLPNLGDFTAAVNADKTSVVRIKGQGCGGIVSGSGFVVGNNLVVTNAHVVAGISTPIVQDVNGSHRAATAWFDPDLDIAVLRTSKLEGKPLTINPDKIPPQTPGAVLGYPGGGNFNAVPAVVTRQLLARGRDIYDQNRTLRSIYEIRATVQQGNSGGPLIAKDGSVIGVIFAESTTYDGVGYTLTTSKVIEEVNQAKQHSQPVSTGQCAE